MKKRRQRRAQKRRQFREQNPQNHQAGQLKRLIESQSEDQKVDTLLTRSRGPNRKTSRYKDAEE